MLSRALILSSLLASAIAFFVLYLYYKEKLTEDQTLLWLFICASIIVISLWQNLLVLLNTYIVKASNITDFVLAMYIAFLLIAGVYFSSKIADLHKKVLILAQEIALLKTHIDDIRNNRKHSLE